MTTYTAIFQNTLYDDKGLVYSQEINWYGEESPSTIEEFEEVKRDLGRDAALEVYTSADAELIDHFASMITLIAISDGNVDVLSETDQAQVKGINLWSKHLSKPALTLAVDNTIH